MRSIDVKYERIHDLRDRQMNYTPVVNFVVKVLICLAMLAGLGFLVVADYYGVQKAHGMEAYAVMKVMDIRGGEVHLLNEDHRKFIVPLPKEINIKKFQDVMVVFYIRYNEGNWMCEPEKGMYIYKVFK